VLKPRWLLALFAVLGPGCRGACPSFDEMDVIDPDGLAGDEAIGAMWDGIDRFARWTGRDGVCVPEVKVVDHMQGLNGRFIGLREPILVASKAVGDPWVVIHEMCHAGDTIEEYHERHPRLFSAQQVRKRRHYRTGGQRSGEAFARTCDDGPQELTISTILEDECGQEVIGDARRFLRHQLWTDVEDEPLSAERPVVTVARSRIAGLSTGASLRAFAGAGDDLLFVMAWEARRVDEPNLGSDEHRLEHQLVRIDPRAGAVVDRVDLPVDIDELGTWSLLPSTDRRPLLVYSGADTQAWIVDAGDLSLVEIPFPQLPEHHAVAGVLIEGRAWYSEVGGEGVVESLPVGAGIPDALADLDLGDRLLPSDRVVADRPEDGLHAGPPDRDVFDQGRGVVWITLSPGGGFIAASGDRIVWYDVDTGQGVLTHLPDTWGLHTLAMAGDGRLVTGNLLWSGVASEVLTGLLVFDPSTGGWALPADPCGAARVARRFALVAISGQPWLIERGSPDDFLDEGVLYLSQVVVGSR